MDICSGFYDKLSSSGGGFVLVIFLSSRLQDDSIFTLMILGGDRCPYAISKLRLERETY